MRSLFLLLALALLAFPGCSSKSKSSAHIYQGDAPTISYGGQESAGGRLRER